MNVGGACGVGRSGLMRMAALCVFTAMFCLTLVQCGRDLVTRVPVTEAMPRSERVAERQQALNATLGFDAATLSANRAGTLELLQRPFWDATFMSLFACAGGACAIALQSRGSRHGEPRSARHLGYRLLFAAICLAVTALPASWALAALTDVVRGESCHLEGQLLERRLERVRKGNALSRPLRPAHVRPSRAPRHVETFRVSRGVDDYSEVLVTGAAHFGSADARKPLVKRAAC